MSDMRTFIARPQANCSTTERRRVQIPADTPEDQPHDAILAAAHESGDVLDEALDGEDDRTMIDFDSPFPSQHPTAVRHVR